MADFRRKGAWVAVGSVWVLLLTGGPVRADEDRGTFTVLVENDSFFSSSDRDYTNGVELLWTSPPRATGDWATRLARALPFFPASGAVRTSYALGQSMFTPQQLSVVTPPSGTRPYAGFLYGALDLVESEAGEQDEFELQLGAVGPLSLAEDAQKFIHAIEGLPKPRGWSTQLRDEPGLVLTYERALKLVPLRSRLGDVLDVEPHFGGAAGNVYDYVNAGFAIRLGVHMPDDYVPARIEPSAPGTNAFVPVASYGAYLFAGFDERAVARNLFLDGNSFEASPRVDKEVLVNELQIGTVAAFGRFRLSYDHVWRSREFRTQPVADEFSSINLSARW